MNPPFSILLTETSFSVDSPVKLIEPLPSETFLLREINTELEAIVCLDQSPGGITLHNAVASTTVTPIRGGDPLAKVVTIRNNGPQWAAIFESGVVVQAIPSGERRTLPERGRFPLTAQTATGFAYLTCFTHQLSACGGPTQFLAPDADPVGSFLL